MTTKSTRLYAMHSMLPALLLLLVLLALLVACSDGDSNDVGSLQISHSLNGSTPQPGDPSVVSVISGADGEGATRFGPVTLPYAGEHTLTDVPTSVVRLRIEHRLGTGRLLALADTPVDIQSYRTTPVVAAAAGAPNHVIVELVNDTDNPGGDEQMYVLFDSPKDGGSATGIDLLSNSGDSSANATGVALSTLWPKDTPDQPTITSPYTGKQRPIYSFTLDNVDSGRLTFSYATPASITDGQALTTTAPLRYDKLEITYLSAVNSGGGNLTAIDFFAIPLQVEVLHWGESTPDPLQTKSVYASTPTLLAMLKALAPAAMGPAFRNTSDAQYQFPATGAPDLSDFARVLSPNTIAANATDGSAVPYPSFGGSSGYLHSLVGKTYTLNGAQYGGYAYTATFASDGKGGYLVHCTGTTTAVQPAPLPSNADVTLLLPKDQLDFFTYATVANAASYSVAGFPFVDDASGKAVDKVKAANASPYGALVGDIQAALNFGFLGGRFDASTAAPTLRQDIDAYYTSVLLPYAYPYGGARVRNDGFYNPYAGLFYYLSDAYGHPYSDRLAAASPLYSLEAGDTVRITILNDLRLDTPLVRVASASASELDLSWPTVSGATGYTVALSPQPATEPGLFTPQAGATQMQKIKGLKPGTSYLVSVTATGSNTGQPIQSAVLPIQGVTAEDPGAQAALAATSDPSPTFLLNLGLTPNFSDMSYTVNGNTVDFGGDASLTGVIGMNTLNLAVLDATQQVVYRGTYFVHLVDAGSGYFDVAAPFTLEHNLMPLTQAGPPGTPPYPLGNTDPLTVGTPFTPKPYYQYFEVVFPQ